MGFGEAIKKKFLGANVFLRRKLNTCVLRYKVHLVVKGYSQKEGVDYHEIYSLVVSDVYISSNTLDMELMYFYVKIGFLHFYVEEDILMSQQGFEEFRRRDKVYKLQRLLYDLKQFSRQPYRGLLSSPPYETCIYHKKVEDNSQVYLLLYVDDILILQEQVGDS